MKPIEDLIQSKQQKVGERLKDVRLQLAENVPMTSLSEVVQDGIRIEYCQRHWVLFWLKVKDNEALKCTREEALVGAARFCRNQQVSYLVAERSGTPIDQAERAGAREMLNDLTRVLERLGAYDGI